MRALILANGDLHPDDVLPHADLVVCADGGTRHALAHGCRPHCVVGDMDSLPSGSRGALEDAGTQFVSYSPSKDETDLELALLYAVDQGATEIAVLGVRGGRLDHELGNLMLLAHPRLREVDVRLWAGTQEVSLVSGQIDLHGEPGDLVSLIPIGGDAQGITTEGLQYSLSDEPLHFGPARGMSNVLLDARARVCVRQGLLLLVHTHRQACRWREL